MRTTLTLIALSLAASAPAASQAPRQSASSGDETTIAFAGNGGLHDWQRGPKDSGVLYVRDRTERWYRVTLTGRCPMDQPLDTLIYTTSINGTFDRFSHVRLLRYPGITCGVASIRRSPPPPGRAGSHRREQR